jgi:hypothetical protein
MVSDMKRLCEAAERAHDDWVKGGYSVKPGEYTIEATPEAIVRAVLTALKKMPRSSLYAAAEIANDGVYEDLIGPESIDDALVAMIDHILAERKP